MVAQATDAPFSIKDIDFMGDDRAYEQPFTYVKQLYDPVNLKTETPSGENSAIYAFMQAYYQAERTTPPVDKNVASPVQAMMMMTSPIVTKRVRGEGTTRVANLLKSGKTEDQMIEELFLSALSRRPKTEEVEVAKRVMATNKEVGLGDIQWALLNTAEFLVNH